MKKNDVFIFIFLQCLLGFDPASCEGTDQVSFSTHAFYSEDIPPDTSIPDKRLADGNDKSEPLPQGINRVPNRAVSPLLEETSAMTHKKVVVHHKMKAAKGTRWKFLRDPPELHGNVKGRHFERKSEKSQSKTEAETEASSAAIVGGILAGLLAIPFIVTVIVLIWNKCPKRNSTIRPVDSDAHLVEVVTRTADFD